MTAPGPWARAADAAMPEPWEALGPDGWAFCDLVQIRGGSFGSGLLVGPGLVLTALHCVADPARGWRFHDVTEVVLWRELAGFGGAAPVERGWSARVVWPPAPPVGGDPPDIALLRLADDPPPPAPMRRHPLRYGRLGIESEGTAALGFPKLAAGEALRGGRQENALSGRANLASVSARAIRFTSDHIPGADDWQQWRGLSGGPLLRDGVLVGVMRGVQERFRTDRTLTAEPLALLLEGPDGPALQHRLRAEPEAAAAPAAPAIAAADPGFADLFQHIYTLDRRAETAAARAAIRPHVGKCPVELLVTGRPADLCNAFFERLWRDDLPPRRAPGDRLPEFVPWPSLDDGVDNAALTLVADALRSLGIDDAWSADLVSLRASLEGLGQPGWVALRLDRAPDARDLALLRAWRSAWAGLAVPQRAPVGYALLYTSDDAADPRPLAALRDKALLPDGLGQGFVQLGPVTLTEVREWHEELARRLGTGGAAAPLPLSAFRLANALAARGQPALTLAEIRDMLGGARHWHDVAA